MTGIKNLVRFLSLFFVLCAFASNKSFAQEVAKDTVDQQNNMVAAYPKVTHFLDGEQVSVYIIQEKWDKGELGAGSGYTDLQTAIRMYGEKYRYGIIFWDSKTTNDYEQAKDNPD